MTFVIKEPTGSIIAVQGEVIQSSWTSQVDEMIKENTTFYRK